MCLLLKQLNLNDCKREKNAERVQRRRLCIHMITITNLLRTLVNMYLANAAAAATSQGVNIQDRQILYANRRKISRKNIK